VCIVVLLQRRHEHTTNNTAMGVTIDLKPSTKNGVLWAGLKAENIDSVDERQNGAEPCGDHDEPPGQHARLQVIPGLAGFPVCEDGKSDTTGEGESCEDPVEHAGAPPRFGVGPWGVFAQKWGSLRHP